MNDLGFQRLKTYRDNRLYVFLAGSKEKTCNLKPFALLNKTSTTELQEGKSAVSFSVPALLDDYCKEETMQISVYAHKHGASSFSFKTLLITPMVADVWMQFKRRKKNPYPSYSPASDTNLLDCSCEGVVALALGSSVYLWNSETRCVVGHLDQATPPGQPSSDCPTRSITCLCWSGDGRILCIGTRRREIRVYAQMWRWEETGSRTVCVTTLNIQFNNPNIQLPVTLSLIG